VKLKKPYRQVSDNEKEKSLDLSPDPKISHLPLLKNIKYNKKMKVAIL